MFQSFKGKINVLEIVRQRVPGSQSKNDICISDAYILDSGAKQNKIT